MSYGPVYRIPFRDKYSRYGFVLISENGVLETNTPVELKMGNNPPTIEKSNNEHFIGSALNFSIETDEVDGMISLFSEDPRHFKVEVAIEYGVQNLITLFSGFLVPEQYEDPYIYPPFDIELSAVDGLGLLKKADFDLKGFHKDIDIISHILSKTGLTLPLVNYIDISVDIDGVMMPALENSYSNCDIFYDDKGPKKCYEVINCLLHSYGPEDTYITQIESDWVLLRPVDIRSGNTHFSKYTIDVEYGAWPVGYLSRKIDSRIHHIKLSNKLYRRDNILPEDLGKNQPLIYFHPVTEHTSFQSGAGSDVINILFGGDSSTPGIAAYMSVPVEASTEETRLRHSLKAVFDKRSDGVLINQLFSQITISISDGTTTYYLTENGWSSAVSEYYFDVTFVRDTVIEHNFIFSEIPITGNLRIDWYKPVDMYSEPVTFVVNEINVFPNIENDSISVPAFVNYDLKLADHVINELEEEFVAGAPDLPNRERMFPAAKRASDGTIIAEWRHINDTQNYDLSEILLRTVASNNRKTRQILSGQLKHSFHRLNTIYVENQGLYQANFWAKTGTWDLYENTVSGDFVEILEYEEQSIVSNVVISYNADPDNDNKISSDTLNASGSTVLPTWENVRNKPSLYPPLEHTHKISEIERLSDMFVYEENGGNPLIRAKLPFVCNYDVVAFASAGLNLPSIFEAIPVGTGLINDNGVLKIDGSVGQGFDETANYNPSGDWNFTGLLEKGGNAVATESWATGQFEAKFTKNTAFNKNFGTASGTVAQGNDSRINNGQTAYGWGDHASQGYATQTWVGNNYHVKGGASDQDFIVNDLIIHGTVNHWVADVITVDDARLQLNRTQDAATVASGIDVYDGTSVVSSLLYGTDNRWKIGGDNIATESWVGLNYLGKTAKAADSDKLDGYQASELMLKSSPLMCYYSDTNYSVFKGGAIEGSLAGGTVSSYYAGYYSGIAWGKLRSGYSDDSDKLDGLQGSQFLRSDANDYTSGWLSVGKSTSPTEALDVNGNIKLGNNNILQINSDSDSHFTGISIRNLAGNATRAAVFLWKEKIDFYLNGVYKARINNTGLRVGDNLSPTEALDVNGNILASGEVTAYSDARLKDIINPTESTLEKINALTIYDYTRNDNEDKKVRTGLLAQDLQKQFPQFVSGKEGKDSYLSINYSEYAATVATKGIQELYAIIQDQSKRIQELEKKSKLI